MRNCNIPLCEETGKQCDPKRVDFCKCWFDCWDPEDFNRHYETVREENEQTKG